MFYAHYDGQMRHLKPAMKRNLVKSVSTSICVFKREVIGLLISNCRLIILSCPTVR